MDWISFFIGFSVMGGFWLTILVALFVIFKTKGGNNNE